MIYDEVAVRSIVWTFTLAHRSADINVSILEVLKQTEDLGIHPSSFLRRVDPIVDLHVFQPGHCSRCAYRSIKASHPASHAACTFHASRNIVHVIRTAFLSVNLFLVDVAVNQMTVIHTKLPNCQTTERQSPYTIQAADIEMRCVRSYCSCGPSLFPLQCHLCLENWCRAN